MYVRRRWASSEAFKGRILVSGRYNQSFPSETVVVYDHAVNAKKNMANMIHSKYGYSLVANKNKLLTIDVGIKVYDSCSDKFAKLNFDSKFLNSEYRIILRWQTNYYCLTRTKLRL